MTTQLDLYNGALLRIGERFLASLTDQAEARRLLDHVWSTGGVRRCLERGQWNFAMRSQQIDYDSGIDPDWGYAHAFEKPDDWVQTSAFCSDEFFRVPVTQYVDEAGYWYANIETIYVRFVSDDPSYGMNFGLWPDGFREYVECYFGRRIVHKLSNSIEEDVKLAMENEKSALLAAKNLCAQTGPTSFPARGNWSNARNRFPNRRDGGNTTGPLIG